MDIMKALHFVMVLVNAKRNPHDQQARRKARRKGGKEAWGENSVFKPRANCFKHAVLQLVEKKK